MKTANLVKCNDIADAIAMTDSALEDLRRQRTKKKAGKDVIIVQALMVARQHLASYRSLVREVAA